MAGYSPVSNWFKDNQLVYHKGLGTSYSSPFFFGVLMKVKDLYRTIELHLNCSPLNGEREVAVALDKPSYGSVASCGVKHVGFGIDWDSNTMLINPNLPLTPKSKNEAVWDYAREFIMWIATKPVKKESYEVGEARRILTLAGIKWQEHIGFLHPERK